MYSVAIVCEGDADREIVKAVLDHYVDDYEPVPVQPPLGAIGGHAGPLGGGWKGVRRWCQQEAPVGGEPLRVLLQNHDLIIVHVDADVAKDHDSGVALPDGARCPPPSVFSEPVRAAVLTWLGLSHHPMGLLLCVPAMATETWALVALFPESVTTEDTSTCIECDEHVKRKLRKLGKKLDAKLVTSEGGRLRNHAKGYAAVAARITEAWPSVVSACAEADRFARDLERWFRAPALARRARRRLRSWPLRASGLVRHLHRRLRNLATVPAARRWGPP